VTATVLCTLRTGGVYDVRYVRALRQQLLAYAPSVKLACLTNVPEQVAPWVDVAIPLEHAWPKWWCLVEWFRPGLSLDGTVIAIGLDTLIVGPLDDLARFGATDATRGKLATIHDFYMPHVRASGVMLWQSDIMAPLYEDFLRVGPATVMARHPRMDFWLRRQLEQHYAPTQVAVIQELYPRQVVSFKAHARNGPTQDARIVCGHGQPQFSDRVAGWAYNYWAGYAGVTA
jgi:hypothetical protein